MPNTLAILLVAATASCAQPTLLGAPDPLSGGERGNQLPPLVDRTVFFGNAEISDAAISPDGRYIAFVKPLNGVQNVWVKGVDEPFANARPVTADTKRPVGWFLWSADGRYVFFLQDSAGNENYRVYAVAPAARPGDGQIVDPPRDLTPYKDVRAYIYVIPKRRPDVILVGLNDRDARFHDVYRVNVNDATRELVFRNDENVGGWVADEDGNLRLGVRRRPDGTREILRVDGGTLTPIYTCSQDETCDVIRFDRDGRRAYIATNKGDADLTYLALLDPQSGAIEVVESDPERQVDFGRAIFSNATGELIATEYVGDRVRLYPRQARFARDIEQIRAAAGDADLFFRVGTRDDRIWIVKATVDVTDGANYIYDRTTGRAEVLYWPQPAIPAQHMARMRPVRYTTRDGVTVSAYLITPKGVAPRGLPVVVYPHGGPWWRDEWGFHYVPQFLANRGYAVLMPQFRGSTGYGKRFLNLGNKQWGTGGMQHDITDGVRWLIAEGIADPRRVGIMGISYGGYATLAGLAFTPELYAAGVSYVGPSSILTLINSFPPYWEGARRLFKIRVGDLQDSTESALLRQQSPLYAATRIRAPLLVLQGANDPRVKKAESEQIVVALRDLRREVEYLVAPDEGHGFIGELNNLAAYAEIERFLARHLGGRYQVSVTPEVAARVATMRVRVDTLKAPVQ